MAEILLVLSETCYEIIAAIKSPFETIRKGFFHAVPALTRNRLNVHRVHLFGDMFERL